jgi:predicted nucleic acid-binding protein
MYFLGSRGGSPLQELLWRYIELEKLRIHTPTDIEPRRMRELMATYSDLPMDLADASLVTAAEATGLYRIFTIDSHFFAYRINGVIPFETVPT